MKIKQKELENKIQDLDNTKVQVRLSLDTIIYDFNKEMDRLLDLRKQAAEQEAQFKYGQETYQNYKSQRR